KACRKVHFCSSTYKDAVQLRKRFQRIAKNTAREFDEITEDGTLVYGVIEGGDQELAEKTLQSMEIPAELFEIQTGKIEIAWWVLEDLKEGIKEELEPSGSRLVIIERYPFKDGLVVELIPL
ncbi:MAG: radical SAM protein, partial [Methanosarcina sp.]|nr:radical SAM protein [Methanosarcina sp.]